MKLNTHVRGRLEQSRYTETCGETSTQPGGTEVGKSYKLEILDIDVSSNKENGDLWIMHHCILLLVSSTSEANAIVVAWPTLSIILDNHYLTS